MQGLRIVAALVFLASAALNAVVLDRIAIVVGHQTITEMQLEEEIRVTAFLNHEPVRNDDATRRGAAGRLVEQQLVRREMQLNQYPSPTESEVDQLVNETAKQLSEYGELNEQLSRYGLSPVVLREHLQFQLMLVKFVDFRFRPDVEVTDSEIRERYEREREKWLKSHTGQPPGLAESRADLEKAIADEKVENALSAWLEETKRQTGVDYLDQELRT